MQEKLTIRRPDGTTQTIEISDKTVTGVRIGNDTYLVSLGDINNILTAAASEEKHRE